MPVQGLARRLRHRFHERRADLFCRLMSPESGQTLLDLGSGWSDPLSLRVARRVELDVTLADIAPLPAELPGPGSVRAVQLGEGEPLPFEDNAFDLVLCNSVIEHATLSESVCRHEVMSDAEWRERALARQRTFAGEIRRVGRRYFVQTPDPRFPLDLHLWLPFTHWLPHEALRRLARVTDRFWIKETGVVDWNLLSKKDLRQLFPGSNVHVERAVGLPKSLVAVGRS